jgi:phosphosulfolactate synthase (CoM biosynthesis protein A)
VSTRAFSALPLNVRGGKPRQRGLTEIRGPYYTVMGRRYLEDILETMGAYVDGLKFAGGSFALMPREKVAELIELAHRYGAYVSTGGWIEYVLRCGPRAVDAYLAEARELGFDLIEISTGFISLPEEDLLRLVAKVRESGMKPKPELGIQFGAGGATAASELAAEGVRDAQWVVSRAKSCLAAGAELIMIESEGITESVERWRTDVVAKIIDGLGIEKVMFEAAEPAVFEWYLKSYGIDVNLFVDHSQIVQLECLRAGIWGTKGSWGRIASFKPAAERSRESFRGGPKDRGSEDEA